jgi:hypothetical protein
MINIQQGEPDGHPRRGSVRLRGVRGEAAAEPRQQGEALPGVCVCVCVCVCVYVYDMTTGCRCHIIQFAGMFILMIIYNVSVYI